MGLATFVQRLVERVIFGISVLVLAAIIAPSPAFARPLRIVDTNDRVTLQGNVNQLARSDFYIGATDPSLPMERLILALRISPDKRAKLDRLLDEQQDPASPNFHHWLTPEEFGEQFGPTPEDINVIIQWLTSQGFVVEEMAKSRTWINFSGTVEDVERAFQTEIHDYIVDNKLRHANATEPSIPRALIDLVAGPVSLNNFPLKAMNTGIRPLTGGELQPYYTSGSSHYLSPGDFATIYNTNALYVAGIDGTGQSIAIVGRTHPSSTNWASFRSQMGLPIKPPQVIVNGTDPGDVGADEDGEADLDVEWSGAVAKNATIYFVVSKSTSTTDGVDLSAQYIVNNNLAPVMSTSFGLCEANLGSSRNAFYNTLWAQAAAQGITSFVSTGDNGVAGCSSASANFGTGLGVNGLATTPYNVAVGGTQFNEGSGSYWNSSNGTSYTSAISYIPEVAWNESGAVDNCPSGDTCSELWATSGGASSIYGKPAWQVAPGVPADAERDIPDVSLTAAGGHDGYLVQTQGNLHIIGGTSAASPSFAGIMALIVQKTGQRQGNANIRLYQLGDAQYGSGGAVFHDTTSGNNSVPGVTGYFCGAGYDLATGLGSVDANALANNWAPLTDDIYEPNNTMTTAYFVTPPFFDSTLRCYDDDWYKVWAQPGLTVQATINFNSAVGDLDLQLYDSSGYLLDSSTSTSNSEAVSYTSQTNDYYYIKVYGYNGAKNAYSMKVDVYSTTQPDLVSLSNISKSSTVTEGELFWVDEYIYNAGLTSAGASHAALYLSTNSANSVNGDYYLGDVPVSALAPETGAWAQWNFYMPNIGTNSYAVWTKAVVDNRDEVYEGNENNIYVSTGPLFIAYDVRTLTVASSNPSSGTSITVSPNDNNGLGSGTTQFSRIYNNNTAVTLTAPSTTGGNYFTGWSGCDSASGTICHVTMSASKTVVATYVTPTSTLTVASSNPSSGTSITVSPNDNNGLGSGTTQFSRTYNNFKYVTLTAPSTVGGNSFGSWTGCDSASANTCSVTLNANRTVMAIYMTPTASPVIRVEGSTTVGSYSTIQSAFNATVSHDIVEMHAMTFNESPNFHFNFPVLLKGGYDSSFSSQVGVTTIHGTLTIGAGTLTVENLIVQ
jgi:subtilase family serine protease